MNKCDCQNPKQGSEFPPEVLEIIQKEAPVLFHKTTFPASIGDDTTNPPDTLNYKNVLLTYEATDKSYLYSSDGVPTLISLGGKQLVEIEKMLTELGAQVVEMGNEVSELQSSVAEVETSLDETKTTLQEETTAREEADTALRTDLTTAQEDIKTNVEDISGLQEQTVQLDTAVSGDGSTVTITKSRGTLAGDAPVATAMPLPVASAAAAGVMNSATFNAVQTNAQDINSILNGAIAITDLEAEPTQETLTEKWKTATGLSVLVNRASIFDVANQKIWYYFDNTSTWYSIGNVPEVTVAQFTNQMAGIIKGSEVPGQIFAEADGTGSVNGWDGIRHDIDNILELLETNPIPKLYDTHSTATDGANTAKFINNRLNNDNIYLGKEAKASSSSGYPDSIVVIGKSAVGANQSTNSFGNIAIGASAKGGGSSSTAVGYVAQATGSNSTAVGGLVRGTTNYSTYAVSYATAIGAGAVAKQGYSVALGYRSETTRDQEVSIGRGSYNRFLANMTDGVLDTDGVNLRQLKASKNRAWAANTAYGVGELLTNDGKLYSVATAFTSGDTFDATNLTEISGGGGTGNDPRLTDTGASRANNLPLQVFYTTGPTDYNGDNIEVHLIQKDLATGGDATMPFTVNAATPQTATEAGTAGVMSRDQATRLSRVPDTVVADFSSSAIQNPDGVQFSLTEKNLTDGTETYPFVSIGPATTTQAGVMTAAQVTKLDNLEATIGDIDTLLTALDTGAGVTLPEETA